MSLNFQLDKIKDFEAVCYTDGTMNPRTEAIIFITMAIGMGSITEKNLSEFVRRIEVFQDIHGGLIYDCDGRKARITKEDVEKHLGLTTNVRLETPGKFKKAMEMAAYDSMVRTKR